MASISHLRAVILSSLNSGGDQDGYQEFFEELMAGKQQLINLYNIGPRSPQEQKEVESGRIVVDGRPLAVNSDFARQVVFISQQLDISERYVASLLQDVMSTNPNVPQEQLIEATVLEFHLRRRQLADCLRYIFEAAEVAQNTGSPELYSQLEIFVRQQLIAEGDKLPQRIYNELEKLSGVIAKVQCARQNATSNTVAPSQQAGQLGYDILNARYDSLKYERRTLATVLFLIGRMGYIAPQDILNMIDWLQKNPHHPMLFYILPAVLACFDVVHPESIGGQVRDRISQDAKLISGVKKRLDVTTEWAEPGLKAVLLLKWTLFLTDTRHRNPALEDRPGFRTDELETQIWNAVQGDCFLYLARTVSLLHKKQGAYPPTSYAAPFLARSEHEPLVELPSEDFKPAILESFEALIRLLITHASSELRKIKQRQEDILLANARTDRSRLFRSSASQTQTRHPSHAASEATHHGPARNDIAMLFSLIGILYSALAPERGLQFWGGGFLEGQRLTYMDYVESTAGKLPAFLQWAVWSTQVKDVDMLIALYDMLAGLSKGQQCSELAYNFLARGGPEGGMAQSTSALGSGPAVSWGAVFGLLEQWTTAGSSSRSVQPTATTSQAGVSQFQQAPRAHHTQHLVLSQQDVLLAQAFLRLLSVVVTHSIAVRVTISGHARFRAIPTLVSLIPLSIPLELKGALFETLASFSLPGAGAAGVEICRSVWTLMERLELINVRAQTGAGASMPPVKGVEVELEEVESVHKLYPETIPFVKLLSTLIHTPKSIPSRDLIAEAGPLNTIPESLGHPHRQPGIGPYVSFVVDNVFARISQREYLRPTDRWRTNDLCLCFIERCLASFDLESLVTGPDELNVKSDALLQLAVHPGHDIMKRMLTHSSLQANILSYIVDGLDGFDKGLAEEEPFFRSAIVRVLRIVHRVLEIQDIFLDVFIPMLSNLEDTSVVGEVQPVSYYIRLDQSLLYVPQYVPAVATYVCYPAYPELMLLSIKILTALTTPSTALQLAAVIDRSVDSIRILDGFQSIMDAESLAPVELAETVAEESTGAGAPDIDEPSDALAQAIRLAVLDFFIQNTQPNKPYPNVAYLFLFGKAAAEDQIQDPAELGARRACIHSLLDIVNHGVPRLRNKAQRQRNQSAAAHALLVTLPALAERCYTVIYQLCKHPRTSDFTMRYLRTREEFFARHLAALPFKVPSALVEPYIEVQYNDASRVITTVPALRAFLRLRSIIFDLVALELHVLTNKGHLKSVTDLLDLLYGNEEAFVEEHRSNWEDEVFKPFHEVGQSHIRMIEFLQGLDFDWSDSLSVQPVTLEFLGQLNLSSCLRLDGSGCEIVDRAALIALLIGVRRVLHAQGRILTASHTQQLSTETTYILESCVIENHRREVQYATASCYESWRRLLDMTLVKCFDRIPYGCREVFLFDLLHVLPSALRSRNTHDAAAAILSEAVLSTLTKLREDRRRLILIHSPGAEASELPAERLYALLRDLLQCITDNNRNELVRGNLYASLVNYIHLITDTEHSSIGHDDTEGLGSSSVRGDSEDPLSLNNLASTYSTSAGPSHNGSSSLIDGSLSILRPAMERLVLLVCGDAIDGAEVWKTVAFVLLDSLSRLSASERQPLVHSVLSRAGFITGFVQGLKEANLRLQGILKPDPDDLNPLYVYEAKMSLLVRMAQSRVGAEKLVESRLILVLADSDFVDARPEADQAFLDRDSFLPSAIQRYHQLLVPALQVVAGIVATLGSKHASATSQTSAFLTSHRDTAILLLKNEVDDISLSSMEEMRLLVSLSTSALSMVPKTELASTSGFGGIHAAILYLAAKTLGNQRWSDTVKPTTDEELNEAAVTMPANGESKFHVKLHNKEMHVRKSIVVYLGTASNFTEHEFAPILSPTVITKQEEGPSRFLATIPSVGDAIDALNHICDGLSHTLKQFLDLSAELASRDRSMENIPEILNIPDKTTFENLDVAQRRSLVNHELQTWQLDTRTRAHALFHLLEMLLLLIWRHLAVYGAEHEASNIQNLNMSVRLAPSFSMDTFRSETARKLAPVMYHLKIMAQETSGLGWQPYEKYLEIMARRLKDIAGLYESPDGGDTSGTGIEQA